MRKLTPLQQSFKSLTNCGMQLVHCNLGILNIADFETMPLNTEFTVRLGYDDILYRKIQDKYGIRLKRINRINS